MAPKAGMPPMLLAEPVWEGCFLFVCGAVWRENASSPGGCVRVCVVMMPLARGGSGHGRGLRQ
eukprot:513654-Hanusia_phi.AAC.1